MVNKLLVELYNRERNDRDEKFIKEANTPKLYDKNVNPFLKNNFIIPVEYCDGKFDGFLVGSCRGLKPATVYLLKIGELNLTLIPEIMSDLVNEIFSNF